MSEPEVFHNDNKENSDDFETVSRKRARQEKTNQQMETESETNSNPKILENCVYIKGVGYNLAIEIKKHVREYQREIGAICKYISKNEFANWRFIQNGILRIACKNAQEKENLIRVTSICDKQVDVSLPFSEGKPHQNMKPSPYEGIVFRVPSSTDIAELCQENDALQAKIISSNAEEDTVTVLIWFNNELPEFITIEGFMRFRVNKYIARPMQCKKCWQFGHLAKFCEKNPVCEFCAKTNCDQNSCTKRDNPRCSNCGQSHKANAVSCPKFIVNKSVLQVANAQYPPLSFREAQHKWQGGFKEYQEKQITQQPQASNVTRDSLHVSYAEAISGKKTMRPPIVVVPSQAPINNEKEILLDLLVKNTLIANSMLDMLASALNHPTLTPRNIELQESSKKIIEQYKIIQHEIKLINKPTAESSIEVNNGQNVGDKPGAGKASGALFTAPRSRTNSDRPATSRPTSRPTSESRPAGNPLPQRVGQVRQVAPHSSSSTPAITNSIAQPQNNQSQQDQTTLLLHQVVAMLAQLLNHQTPPGNSQPGQPNQQLLLNSTS